jgi:hypothetical protein
MFELYLAEGGSRIMLSVRMEIFECEWGRARVFGAISITGSQISGKFHFICVRVLWKDWKKWRNWVTELFLGLSYRPSQIETTTTQFQWARFIHDRGGNITFSESCGNFILWSWSSFEKTEKINMWKSYVTQFRHVLRFCHSTGHLRLVRESQPGWDTNNDDCHGEAIITIIMIRARN